jgi:hypothetical protein
MTVARRITSDADLTDVATRGAGFVIDPFNRRWHRASCSRVAGMTTGQPKWFADSDEALEQFLEQRLADYATAKPIVPCPACNGVTPRATLSHGDADKPELTVTPTSRGFIARSSHRVTFGPAKGSPEAMVKAELCRHLASLKPEFGELLHAVFGGSIPVNSDVENQLIYNVFDGSGSAALARGVRFELDDAQPEAAFEYRYELAAPGAALAHWVENDPTVVWPAVTIVDGRSDRLLARTWWTLVRADVQFGRRLRDGERFAVRAELTVPQVAQARLTPERIKQLLDGVVSAFQHHPATDEAVARIATQIGIDKWAVGKELASDQRAVLGAAERAIRVTSTGVQWNPNDTRLVAAEIAVRSHEVDAPQLAGHIAAVSRRDYPGSGATITQ